MNSVSPCTKVEAVTPREVFEQLVSVAGEDVLIGGQALAGWWAKAAKPDSSSRTGGAIAPRAG